MQQKFHLTEAWIWNLWCKPHHKRHATDEQQLLVLISRLFATAAFVRYAAPIAIFVGYMCIVMLTGCNTSCDNDPIGTTSSPSGKLKAVVFSRSCGATTGFSSQLSILEAKGSLPDEGGNTLVLDGPVELKVHWVSESALKVSGLGTARVFKQEASVNGVSISYE